MNKCIKLKASGSFLQEITKNKTLYMMTIPGILLFLAFNYLPLAGIIVAFKEFKLSSGVFGSQWIKPFYKNFEFFFSSSTFLTLTRNTLFLNLIFILFGTFFAVAFSVMLNEMLFTRLKKFIQAGMLMPYFISWIVVGVFAYALLNYDYGSINLLLKTFGGEAVNWYNTPQVWSAIMTVIYIWKFVGYNSVIYIAVLAGIDVTYFEAAKIDGTTKMQQIWYISIPYLLPTVTTMTLLSIGRIMNADFGMFYAVIGENPILYPTVDVIDTYVYRSLRKLGDVGMSSAVGFYQSCVAFLLVLICNKLSYKVQPEGSIF